MAAIQQQMKDVLLLTKKKSGYVSIEVVLIAGLIIVLALFLVSEFTDKATDVKEGTITQIDNAMDKYADFENIGGDTPPTNP